MTQTIEMRKNMTLAEMQQAFETAATLEGFHARVLVCAFPDRYIRSAEYPEIHFVAMDYGEAEVAEMAEDDFKWSSVNPDDDAYSELSIDYPLNPADGTRCEPGRVAHTQFALRTSDIADKFGMITDPNNLDNQDIVPDLFGIIFLDHDITLPLTADSTITLADFSDGGLDYTLVTDRDSLPHLFPLYLRTFQLSRFTTHPQGQQMVDLSMRDAANTLRHYQKEKRAEKEPDEQHHPQPASGTPNEHEPTQGRRPRHEPTPPQYRVAPSDPNPIYPLDDIQSKRPGKTLKQNCSYFSRMVRNAKPSAKDITIWPRSKDAAYHHIFRWLEWHYLPPYAYLGENEATFISAFVDEYPALAGDFDLLGRHDWPQTERERRMAYLFRKRSDWLGLSIFGLAPVAALVQQLPADHPIRKIVGSRIVQFEYLHCLHDLDERYEIVQNSWLNNQIEYWSHLPATAKPYQRRLQNDVVEAYIELDTLLEQGWKEWQANPEYPPLQPVEAYLELALEAVTNTDPIRLDGNAVRVLAACNLAVLFNAMNMQLDLSDPENTVMPESLRSLRYNAKWCIDTLRDPQKKETIKFTGEEYFGRYFGSLLPDVFAKDWFLHTNEFALLEDYSWNTPPLVIRTLCKLVSAANSEDGRADPNDFFSAAGSEPQFMVRNLKKRYELDDLGQMTDLMGCPVVPGLGKRVSWLPEQVR